MQIINLISIWRETIFFYFEKKNWIESKNI